MGRVVAVGESTRVAGFALAGAEVVAAEDAPAVRDAWSALGADVAVLLLTPAAAEVLERDDALDTEVAPGRPLVVVMP